MALSCHISDLAVYECSFTNVEKKGEVLEISVRTDTQTGLWLQSHLLVWFFLVLAFLSWGS